jgi:hypothetical protein
MSEGELGAALTALAPDLEFPQASADLAALAVARLGDESPAVAPVAAPGRRPLRIRRWVERIVPPRGVRRVLVIALLVVAFTGIAAGATYLGVQGIKIVFDNGRPGPTASAGQPSSPLPSPTLPSLGDEFELGSPTTLDLARDAVDFPVSVPPLLAQYDSALVFLSDQPFGGRVSFVWTSPDDPGNPALLLTEFHADPYKEFIEKIVFGGGDVQNVRVNGERGYWIDSAHEITYFDEDKIPFSDQSRLAGPVLLWTQGDVTLRLEGASSLKQALAIARATH